MYHPVPSELFPEGEIVDEPEELKGLQQDDYSKEKGLFIIYLFIYLFIHFFNKFQISNFKFLFVYLI